MSAADKLAQVLAEHGCDYEDCASCGPVDDLAAHQAAVVLAHLTAEGWGNLAPARIVLADREAELLEVKGPCSFKQCRLHYGHRGPCDTRRVTDWEPAETGDQK